MISQILTGMPQDKQFFLWSYIRRNMQDMGTAGYGDRLNFEGENSTIWGQVMGYGGYGDRLNFERYIWGFVPDPTQGTAVRANSFYPPLWQHPLRIPTLVATRPRLILTI